APAELGVAQVSHRVVRDVGHRLGDHDVEHQEIVERGARQADRAGKDVRRIDRKARAEQADIERRIRLGERARRGMAEFLADLEVFEEVAGVGLVAHAACSSLIAAAVASARSACSTWRFSIMRPSTVTTPLPAACAALKAATILPAVSSSAADGAKISLHGSTWLG